MDTVQAENSIIGILQRKNKMNLSNRGILLNGPWGIGKTYTIESLSQSTSLDGETILISIFGKESIQDIERSIIIKLLSKKNKLKFERPMMYAKKAANDLINKFSGIDIDQYINLLSIDDISFFIEKESKYLICLDDIERKSKNVNIQDLMGLVERLKKNFDVILISNTLRMDEKDFKQFGQYKEKVINHEVNIEVWHRETLVQILQAIEFDQKDVIIDIYMNYNESNFYHENKKEMQRNLSNMRIFNKYIELILITLDELNAKKIDIELLKLCKSVVYRYFYPSENKKDLNIYVEKYRKFTILNKILHYEKLFNEEKNILIDNIAEVEKDISCLFQSYKLNERELDKLKTKIKQKAQLREKEYFFNELNIISIVNGLEKNRLLDEETENNLLNLAVSMYIPEYKKKHIPIQSNIMNDYDFRGELVRPSQTIIVFIKKLNDKCNEKFDNYIKNEVQKSKKNKDYSKLLQLEKSYKIKSIDEFIQIFDFFFENLIETYTEENVSNINKLIYATDSSLIRNFFIEKQKKETLPTLRSKYAFFENILSEKMYWESTVIDY